MGASGLLVKGLLGIGCWAWGDARLWGWKNTSAEINALHASFTSSVKHGVDLFDTAELYGGGRSEELLGSFAKSDGVSPFVATKFFPSPLCLTAGSLSAHLDDSLRRLQRAHVDLYFVHGMAASVRSVETWCDQLAVEFKSGRIKAVGVSNFTKAQLQRAHARLQSHGVPLAAHQIEYSLLRRA